MLLTVDAGAGAGSSRGADASIPLAAVAGVAGGAGLLLLLAGLLLWRRWRRRQAEHQGRLAMSRDGSVRPLAGPGSPSWPSMYEHVPHAGALYAAADDPRVYELPVASSARDVVYGAVVYQTIDPSPQSDRPATYNVLTGPPGQTVAEYEVLGSASADSGYQAAPLTNPPLPTYVHAAQHVYGPPLTQPAPAPMYEIATPGPSAKEPPLMPGYIPLHPARKQGWSDSQGGSVFASSEL
jgi:hypothetical protein